ncbi:hypothetical protein HMPREF0880_00950 [Yokenella regensburgei ATCC 43003]|jgi:hypothetical protein|nr:hypothetical protein HMPREF0880_00950 [Yokenella regensburgei ATCC 43003]
MKQGVSNMLTPFLLAMAAKWRWRNPPLAAGIKKPAEAGLKRQFLLLAFRWMRWGGFNLSRSDDKA